MLKATFPAGTLSGAPKPRALRLLDELEPHRRGIYGGVVGYLDFAGDMDMAIAIRSALLRDGRAYVQAGGGIVADSDQPDRSAWKPSTRRPPRCAPCTPPDRCTTSRRFRSGRGCCRGYPSSGRRSSGSCERLQEHASQPASKRTGSRCGHGSPRWCCSWRSLALAVFGTTTQTWLTVRLDPAAGPGGQRQDGLHVQGSKAATTVTALALVALAGGLASLHRRQGLPRWIIAAIIVLASAGIVIAAVTVLADPLGAAQGSIAADHRDLRVAAPGASSTGFPVLAVVAAGPAGLAGGLLTSRGPATGRRAPSTTSPAGQPSRVSGPVDEIDSWDRLSRGEDPT